MISSLTDRFSALSRDEQRLYMAKAIGCNPDHPEGWPDRLVNDLVRIRLEKGTAIYYQTLGYLLSLR